MILTQGMDATTPQDTEPAVETLCRGASNQVLKVFSFVELIVPSTIVNRLCFGWTVALVLLLLCACAADTVVCLSSLLGGSVSS